MSLCDRLRDSSLLDLGIYLEDRDGLPALIRPVSREMIRTRAEIAEKARQKQAEKERMEREALEKAEKGNLSHKEMFRTTEFSEWDSDGMPTKDASGEPLARSKGKKVKKEWERQKRLHETWLASQAGNLSIS